MQKGITLIETVVAVTILTFALGGPFLLAGKSLRTAGYAREEVVAARLAEEGLEMVRNIRDNNSIETDAAAAWMDNLGGVSACEGAKQCALDIAQAGPGGYGVSSWLSNATILCGGTCSGTAAAICQYSSGFYRQMAAGCSSVAGWRDTGMTRIINLATSPNSKREYIVTSEVVYHAGGATRKITLQDTLMNWFPALPLQ